MDRINAADWIDLGGGRRGFRDENLPNGILGTVADALWLNAIQEELASIIEGAGLPLSNADWTQLGKALQRSALNYVVAGGTSEALTGALTPAPSANTPGMVVRVRTGAVTNKGPVTLDLGAGVLPVLSMYGEPLLPAALPTDGIVELVCTGTAWVFTGLLADASPTPLRADTTLYVRTDGSDLNDGSTDSAAAAFKTIQAAINFAQRRFVAAGFAVKIKVGSGTYAENVTVLGSMLRVILEGNPASPALCAINGTVYATRGGSLYIDGFQINAAGNNDCLAASDRAGIEFANLRFGTAVRAHIYCINLSTVWARSNYQIVGAAPLHLSASAYGLLSILDVNVGINAGLTFSNCFAFANNGTIMSSGCTFAGTSGVRYRTALNGLIYTAGSGENYFPGNAAGVVTTAGNYI
ncbi:hypothetical protein [Shinella pollutisoli]|uniref:Uncharacterized protein n=1 Tax=Shinella pollutisoli TaxID=2250594 RepID=A0ABV7DIC6_9HYPH|nr:hypothetical protein [Shinella pollutisoli]